MDIAANIKKYKEEIGSNVSLVAVSKTKPETDIMLAYNVGQRVFGENKVQELTEKWENLPKDIEWHMVGHVQRNKVKYMAPFVQLIHAVDSLKLLKEINKEARKNDRTINCLLQLKIATEDSKFGLSLEQAKEILASEAISKYQNVRIIGLMGMATYTDDTEQVRKEFLKLKKAFDDLRKDHQEFKILSMGMSGDYKIAIECGSNMIRIGSSIFGEREISPTPKGGEKK